MASQASACGVCVGVATASVFFLRSPPCSEHMFRLHFAVHFRGLHRRLCRSLLWWRGLEQSNASVSSSIHCVLNWYVDGVHYLLIVLTNTNSSGKQIIQAEKTWRCKTSKHGFGWCLRTCLRSWCRGPAAVLALTWCLAPQTLTNRSVKTRMSRETETLHFEGPRGHWWGVALLVSSGVIGTIYPVPFREGRL